MKTEWITTADERFSEWIALRQRILRDPLGLRFSRDDLEAEHGQDHLIASEDGAIRGGLIVLKGGDRWKIRQVAVDQEYQGRGIGREVMMLAHERAKAEGARELFLHARVEVIGFYERLGYETDGPSFVEVGIPHQRMFYRL